MKTGWIQFSEFMRRDPHDLSLSEIVVAVASLNGCQVTGVGKGSKRCPRIMMLDP